MGKKDGKNTMAKRKSIKNVYIHKIYNLIKIMNDNDKNN
jgi:hypothetical protein